MAITATGSLTSTAFDISHDYLSFRIAGGVHPGTRIEVLVKGEVVKDCSGIENWMLKANYFDLSEWRGQSAQIRIVDEVEAFWGHIIADDFQITDTRPNFLAWNQHERTFIVSKEHLVFPIHNLPETVERGFRDRKDWLEVKVAPYNYLSMASLSVIIGQNWPRIKLQLTGMPRSASKISKDKK